MVDEENPTCGDHIKLSARVADGRVADVQVDCAGCAICTASASIMSEMVVGRPVGDALELGRRFMSLMRGEGSMSDDELGDLVALKGVTRYPLRVKCATMGWHALETAVRKQA
jgi:nitrogen fixation protein NifU and related proteins